MDNFHLICRVCLNSGNFNDFTQISRTNSDIGENLSLFGGIQITEIGSDVICSLCLKELFQCISFRKKCQSANDYFKTQSKTLENVQTQENNENWIEEEKLVEEDFVTYESVEEETENDLNDHHIESDEEYIIEKIDECDENFIESTIECPDETPIFIPPQIQKPTSQKKINSQCRFCGILLSRRSRRIEHERLHMLDQTQEFYKCFHCDKSFNQKSGLIPHFRSCHGFVPGPPERWKCGICEHKILKPGNMALHYEKEHQNFNFNTTHSTKFLTTLKVSSERIKPPKKPKANLNFWPCSVCGNSFSNYQRYEKHLKQIHQVDEQQIADETSILKSSAILSEYNQVAKKKTGKIPCSTCGKVFASAVTVRAHEKTHLNIQYTCDLCGSSFKVKAYLTAHMQKIHMKIFKFKCNIEGCNEKFIHRELFNYHIKKHYNIRNFACRFCDKTFIARATCLTHEKIHIITNQRNPKTQLKQNEFYNYKVQEYNDDQHVNVI